MSFESWLAFCSIALIATLSPGPAVLLVSTHSLQHGFWHSLITVLGNISGLFVMSAASVLGLSTLILVSATAFTLVKLAGAGYLIWLGIKFWRYGLSDVSAAPGKSNTQISKGSLYRQGLLVALTNPKAIVFTTALFPQFIQLNQPLFSQFMLLVFTFMGFSFVCLAGYGWLADQAKKYRKKNAAMERSGKLMGKIFGGSFIGAGMLLAATQK